MSHDVWATFTNDAHSLKVGESLFRKDGRDFQIIAANPEFSAAASLPKADAPAFALAILEAAGYAADNSCAGDAIRSLKFQIANEARAAEEAELDKEAEALARIHWSSRSFQWPPENNSFKDLWLNVARKARELHKTEEAKA